jgi:small subunit ribosomal protein S8
MVNDPIGDFITRLKNGAMVGKREVAVPYSRLKESVAVTLKKCGYLTEVADTKEGIARSLVVTLAYGASGSAILTGVKRISKPGRRLYASASDVHPIKYGRGHLVLSTPKGILVDAEARKHHVGGETLFAVW